MRQIDVYKMPTVERQILLRNVKESIQFGLQHIESAQQLNKCQAELITCQAPSPINGDINIAYILRSYQTEIAIATTGDIFDVLLPMYGEKTRTSCQHIWKMIRRLESKNIPYSICIDGERRTNNMIRLMINNYNDVSASRLAELFEADAEEMMSSPDCTYPNCDTCKYRHLCDDLVSTSNYLNNLRK